MEKNIYTIKDIRIDMSESFEVTVTEEDMAAFAKLSGDYNDLHIDSDFAKINGFKDRVVYGMLSAAFYSRLVGMYLPGKHCLLNSCNVTFRNPVFIGDKLTVTGTVKDIRYGTQRVKIFGEIKNSDGIETSTAEIMVGFTDGE